MYMKYIFILTLCATAACAGPDKRKTYEGNPCAGSPCIVFTCEGERKYMDKWMAELHCEGKKLTSMQSMYFRAW